MMEGTQVCPQCREPWIGVPLVTPVQYTGIEGMPFDRSGQLRKCRPCGTVWITVVPEEQP